ncbi:RNA-directed DNA polymerase, eukaryota [Tanacetum coccineum]
MESIRRNFFDGVENGEKKMSLICGKNFLASKKNGGLGVSSFFLHIIALFFSNGFGDLLLMVPPFGLGLSKLFMVLVELLVSLLLTLEDRLGLILLVKLQISPIWVSILFLWLIKSFRRPPRSGIEEKNLFLLLADTSFVMLPNISDRWSWQLDSTGIFSMKSVREFIDDSLLPRSAARTRWVKHIPIKINIFAWRVSLDKLSMRLNLSLRGLDISSIICPLCSIYRESTSHLLFSCLLARQLMCKVVRWWDLEYQDLLSYEDWLCWLNNLRISKRFKDMFEWVCYTTWWVIWKHRNQVLFGNNLPRLDLLFDETVRMSFYWCSSRCNLDFDWNSWMKNHSSINL